MKGCIVGVNSDSCTDWHLKYFTKLQSNIDEMFPLQFLFDSQKSERKIKDNLSSPLLAGAKSHSACDDSPASYLVLMNCYTEIIHGAGDGTAVPSLRYKLEMLHTTTTTNITTNHLKYIDNTGGSDFREE